MKRLLFVAVLAFSAWHCSKQSDPEEPKKKEEKEEAPAAKPADIVLLEEIRDILKNKN